MGFKYKWKNGGAPSRDNAICSKYLLEDGQFYNQEDRSIAEQEARKHLGLPTRIPDDNRSILGLKQDWYL